jgi:O-antigen ligase
LSGATVEASVALAIVALAAGVALARPAWALPLLVLSLPWRLPLAGMAELPTLVLLGVAIGRAGDVARAASSRTTTTLVLLALPAWVLVSAAWARAPWFAAREAGKWLAVMLAAGVAMAHERRDPRPLVAAFLAVLLPSAAWGLAERLHWVRPLGDPRELALRVITLGDLVRGRALFYHPNRLGEFVEQVGMVLVSCAIFGPWRALCAAGALLAVAGTWATGSAASFAVMAGGGMVAAATLLAWRSGLAGRWRRDPAARRGFALATAGVALAAVAAAVVARQAWVAHGGLGPRGRVYVLAGRVIRESPWLGVGGGNWGFQAAANPVDRFWFSGHTHSIVLQWWTELGIVGVLIGAISLLWPVALGFAGARRSSLAWRGVAVGASCGVIALLAHDMVHWFLRLASDGLMTGVLLGLAAGSSPVGVATDGAVGDAPTASPSIARGV